MRGGQNLATLAQVMRVWTRYKRQKQPWWIKAANCLLILGFVVCIAESGPEFRAILWHARHGNTVCLNGVTFPVYFWHAPTASDHGFDIDDAPGPLRDDRTFTLMVSGVPDKSGRPSQDQFEADISVRPFGVPWQRYTLPVAGEMLRCADQGEQFRLVFCRGEGPIYSIHFLGGLDSYRRFRRMMSAAR